MTPELLARQREAIERWVRVFHPHPGAAVELRALHVAGRKAVCEVFGDLAALAARAAELDGLGAAGCYFTPNPLRRDLAGSPVSARKADVVARRWLLVDCDPVRPAGWNSSGPEKEAAWRVLDRCRGLLDAAGLQAPVVGDSGNGWHLCYPVDLPADDQSQALLKAVLKGLSQRCGDALDAAEEEALKAGTPPAVPKAGVDTSTHDAPRIWKLYGTRARKGPHSDERPHRWARLVEGEPWDAAVAQANARALQALPQAWQAAEDLRRGRPQGEPLTPAGRARRYVEKMPPAVSGQRGHDQAFEVAQVLARGFSLGRSDSWPILCEYNARCVPPWSEPELRHKIEDAEQNSKLPHGYLLGAPAPAVNGNGRHANGHAPAGRQALRLPAEPMPPPEEPRVPPFPLDVLPPWLRRFCEEGAASLCCPLDYLAVPMLSAAGSAAGASRSLRLTAHWWVLPALYVCTVAPSGSAKSPAASRPLSVVRRRQSRNWAGYKARKKEWEGLPEDERGGQPVFVRTYTTHTTVEKLVPVLAESPRGLLLLKDELLSWVGSMDQYREGGKGDDRQTYLSVWDHQGLSIERKSNEGGLPVQVRRPCLSVYGTIQPDVVHRLSREGEQDGFLERILFSCPDPFPGQKVWRWDDISTEAYRAWEAVADRLYALEMADPLEEGDDPWPRSVLFDAGGAAAWEEWYAAHQRLRAGLPEAMHPAHAKMESYCARLALLLQLLWYAHDADPFDPLATPEVSAASVDGAGRLVAYFLAHARKAHGCLDRTPADRRADRAADWLRRQGGQADVREMLRHRVAGVKKASEVLRLVEDLADRGLGATVIRKADNGRDVVSFQLNGADSVDTVSTGPVDAISPAAQGLARSVDSVTAPQGVEG